MGRAAKLNWPPDELLRLRQYAETIAERCAGNPDDPNAGFVSFSTGNYDPDVDRIEVLPGLIVPAKFNAARKLVVQVHCQQVLETLSRMEQDALIRR